MATAATLFQQHSSPWGSSLPQRSASAPLSGENTPSCVISFNDGDIEDPTTPVAQTAKKTAQYAVVILKSGTPQYGFDVPISPQENVDLVKPLISSGTSEADGDQILRQWAQAHGFPVRPKE